MDKVYLVSPTQENIRVKVFTSPNQAILFYQKKFPTWGLRLSKDKDTITNSSYDIIFNIEEYKIEC